MISPYPQLLSSDQSNNDIWHHIDDYIRNVPKLLQFTMLTTKLSNYSRFPFYMPVIHAPMNILEAVGFRWVFCDTCESAILDPIFSFDRLDSAVKPDHTCKPQALSKTQNRTDISDFKKVWREEANSYLKWIISVRLGSGPIFLTAEELQAPCSQQVSVSTQRLSSKGPYIDLGRVNNDHWAHRAKSGQDRRTILKMEELLEFLNLATSTFAAFQVELVDGMRHYLFLYINLPK